MKTRLPYLIISTFILCLFYSSCRKCNPCNDEKLVHVNNADMSPATFQWEISQAVQHSNGTATSSISIVPSGTTVINSTFADSITTTAYLTATDGESGIKCIRLFGGFGYTCLNEETNQAIVLDGILPKKDQCLPLTTCCLKSQRITMENLGQFITCTNGRKFTNGGVGITGVIENCKGLRDTVFLTVQF